MIEDRDREHLVAVYLDTKHQVLGVHVVSIGTINAAPCEPRGVFTAALLCNAARVILAHNHPSGDPSPSTQDLACARQLLDAGRLLGVEVLDFVIVGRGTYLSLRERGDV